MAATVSDGTLAVLTVQRGRLAGQQFPVTKPSVTIGRTADNDIVINDPDISRHHARLSYDGQQFIIEDLGSTNGTFVNNVRLTAPQPLPSGASLGLGVLSLGFQSNLPISAFEPATRMGGPVPQQPPTIPMQAYPPAPMRAKSAISWPLILGGGAVVLLGLLALTLAAFFLLRPASIPSTLAITSPLNGSQVTVGEGTSIIAMASDQQGLARVEFWVDGGIQDSVNNPNPQGQTAFPVQFEWIPEEQGSHALEIRAYNRSGQSSESESVVVRAVPGEAAATTDTSIVVVPTATGSGVVVQDTPTTGAVAGGCTSNLAFVADVTIPDYTPVEPGQQIDKIWRVQNSGTCPWGPGYQLAYVSGDQMSGPPSQAVASTPPGGTADLQVTLYAPGAPGTYKGIWQMKDTAGQPFGTRITVVVVVPASGGVVPGVSPSPGEAGSGETGPTDTPDSSGCSATIDFRADDAIIEAGDHTTVRWDVECVREVYFQGAPVTGHESRDVSPAGVTVYTLRVVKNDGSSEERRVTVSVTSGDIGVVGSTEVKVDISYHSYDPDTGVVWFRVTSQPDSVSVGRVDRRIWNYSSDEVYYYGYTLHSFYSSPSPGAMGTLEPGQTRYIYCTLSGRPTGVRCRGEFTFHVAGGGEAQATEQLDFALPAAEGGGESGHINANISYHSYDASSRWVTFRVVNTGDVTLESAWAQIIAPGALGNLYGPGTSDSPFRDSATSDTPSDSVAPGATRYMRYKINEAPAGTAVSAAIKLYSGEGSSGQSMERTIGFILPGSSGGGGAESGHINANISYHSYDRSSRWVTFRVVNTGDLTLESAWAQIRGPGALGNLYGPGTSDSPFRNSPTSDTLVDSVAPGATKYMRYKLKEAPAGTAVSAAIKLYSGEGSSGQSMERTTGFILP